MKIFHNEFYSILYIYTIYIMTYKLLTLNKLQKKIVFE